MLWGSGPYDAKQVDIWTCGITLYVMLFGRYPFQKKEDMLNWIQFPNRPQVSADVKDLILKMVTRSPDARITLEDICSHSWTSQVFAFVTDYHLYRGRDVVIHIFQGTP